MPPLGQALRGAELRTVVATEFSPGAVPLVCPFAGALPPPPPLHAAKMNMAIPAVITDIPDPDFLIVSPSYFVPILFIVSNQTQISSMSASFFTVFLSRLDVSASICGYDKGGLPTDGPQILFSFSCSGKMQGKNGTGKLIKMFEQGKSDSRLIRTYENQKKFSRRGKLRVF
jgi:hypothetical protein